MLLCARQHTEEQETAFFLHKTFTYCNGALSCWLSLLQFQWSGEHRAGHHLMLKDRQEKHRVRQKAKRYFSNSPKRSKRI